ncbi:hypothetical protein Dimus_004293 [Dionaea muscipula]
MMLPRKENEREKADLSGYWGNGESGLRPFAAAAAVCYTSLFGCCCRLPAMHHCLSITLKIYTVSSFPRQHLSNQMVPVKTFRRDHSPYQT